MPRGPLPHPDKVRRNAPTIPTTNLPASGYQGVVPELPAELHLAAAGRAWWEWAWSTPQAAGWSVGDRYLVARRASLEDDLAALDAVSGLNLDEVTPATLRPVVSRLAAMATGRLSVMREMRELDDRLALSPKGMATLRWKVVDDGSVGAASPAKAKGASAGGTYGHLRQVKTG